MYLRFTTVSLTISGKQKPKIEEEETIQWPKEKGQTVSSKHYTEN